MFDPQNFADCFWWSCTSAHSSSFAVLVCTPFICTACFDPFTLLKLKTSLHDMQVQASAPRATAGGSLLVATQDGELRHYCLAGLPSIGNDHASAGTCHARLEQTLKSAQLPPHEATTALHSFDAGGSCGSLVVLGASDGSLALMLECLRSTVSLPAHQERCAVKEIVARAHSQSSDRSIGCTIIALFSSGEARVLQCSLAYDKPVRPGSPLLTACI